MIGAVQPTPKYLIAINIQCVMSNKYYLKYLTKPNHRFALRSRLDCLLDERSVVSASRGIGNLSNLLKQRTPTPKEITLICNTNCYLFQCRLSLYKLWILLRLRLGLVLELELV